jgi:hypothetical protein
MQTIPEFKKWAKFSTHVLKNGVVNESCMGVRL